MKGMIGMREIKLGIIGIRGIRVGMMGMWGIGMGMRGIRVGMQGIGGGNERNQGENLRVGVKMMKKKMWRGIKIKGNMRFIKI